ncbi:MAG: hypothetical protein EOP84_17395 [Verrucomicrobiaceae bacterium]|nr:MAG: hypothetical protein EOP84_17395 [Verrucomicrobiaceae bacterium]
MSWSETFPIFTDEMIDEFETLSTPEERAAVTEWYAVKHIYNAQDKAHIVSVSLFWKNMREEDPDLPIPTRHRMEHARELGLAKRFDPWPHYVQPLLDYVPKLLESHPDVVVRVHLANDLDFLIADLVDAGCEVWLMNHNSIRFAPGGLWRMLPFEERGKLITMADTDRMEDIPADIERTRSMEKAGLGVWRVPVPLPEAADGSIHYRPFIGSQIGLIGGWPMQQLLQSFTWHAIRGTIPQKMPFPGCGERVINWGSWPNHYFDEWFMAIALYPRLATSGMVTFVSSSTKSTLLLMLDIEYATWSNPDSQLVFFPGANCCSSFEKTDWSTTSPATGSGESSSSEHLVKLPS